MLRETGGQKEDVGALVIDHGSDELLRGTVNDPAQLAGAGIVAGHAFAAGEDHLGRAADGADEGVQ